MEAMLPVALVLAGEVRLTSLLRQERVLRRVMGLEADDIRFQGRIEHGFGVNVIVHNEYPGRTHNVCSKKTRKAHQSARIKP